MEWIDVCKSFPSDNVRVLCYCSDICSSWYEVLCWDDDKWLWIDQDDREVPYIVTHWAQLTPPK